MEKKASLKLMRCPTCGGSLKAENGSDVITCVYCGNSVVPVAEAAPTQQEAAGFGSMVRVEGIKTPSSALAYLEQYFEEYDWDAFAYVQSLSIESIDQLADSLKHSSADDKNTWFVCFQAISVPYLHKIAGCKKILDSVINEYRQDNLEAYSKFDAYKRIATMICTNTHHVLATLEKILGSAIKYGASAEEANNLKAVIDKLKTLTVMEVYGDIEDIPELKAFNKAEDEKIAKALSAKGINAEKEYLKAKELVAQKNYVDALNVLLSLEGYSDSADLADQINHYFLISDVLEICGNLYYFKDDDDSDALDLYSTADGEIAKKPLIENIRKIVTNYADILYYLNTNNKLKKYNFSTDTNEKLSDLSFDGKQLFGYDHKMFMLAKKVDQEKFVKKIVSLDLATGTINTLIENAHQIVSLTGNKMIYTVAQKLKDPDGYDPEYEYDTLTCILTNVINVDTGEIVELGTKDVDIEGFLGNHVVYTQKTPNQFNRNLYIKSLNAQEPEKLIEQNIYRFCDIISDKLFYYVGNSKNQSLISICSDGSGRKEWPLYISEVLFAQGDWLYFIRKSGYNAILCKSRMDGSKFRIVTTDIDEFVEIKNGYLYYINDSAALVKVRMDGSNLQKLCDDVETVLSVKEDKIIFISIDDKVDVFDGEKTATRAVKSIYAVNFSGSGKIKLAYNIKNAKEYDDNTIYYLAAPEVKSTDDELTHNYDILYKLDVPSTQTQLLLNIQRKKKKQGCYVATCVYGSYDCPQVWTLRRYRDSILAATWYGRGFIRVYYAISPTLVKWFGDTKWFKNLWHGKLDRMVSKLQAKGIESTPYQDKAW